MINLDNRSFTVYAENFLTYQKCISTLYTLWASFVPILYAILTFHLCIRVGPSWPLSLLKQPNGKRPFSAGKLASTKKDTFSPKFSGCTDSDQFPQRNRLFQVLYIILCLVRIWIIPQHSSGFSLYIKYARHVCFF